MIDADWPKEEALREGRRAVELLPVEKDPRVGKAIVKYLAIIAAWVGDKDSPANSSPSSFVHLVVSSGNLKLQLFWDRSAASRASRRSSLHSRQRSSEQVAAIDLIARAVRPECNSSEVGLNRLIFESYLGLPYCPRRSSKSDSLVDSDATISSLPRNLAPDLGQYTGERLELSSQ
jgi:hypothetical protein